MNVLFLDQFSELGGAQRCLLDLLPALKERGWRASAALPGDGPLVELLRERNVTVSKIPCGPYRSGGKSIPDMFRFRRDLQGQLSVLRSLECDLVYVNGPRVLPAAAIAFGGRAPVLFHAHSRVPPGPSNWLAHWSIRRSNATVVACAKAIAPNVRRDKLKVVANGTPDLGFANGRLGRQRIGMIGRIDPNKGQLVFLRAAEMLARDLPDARFVICGAPISPAGRYFREVQRWADHLGVDLLGWRQDIAEVLADLDLLVIASKTEGMPRVMLEAFSAGVPVLAFAVGGIPEVIIDGETGFLVHERTALALAARIREVTQLGEGSLRKVAQNARREWERKYTVENYRNNLTRVIENLVYDWRAEHGTESLQLRR